MLTDAAVSDENSGAPFVNAYGELVGINAIGFTDSDSHGLALQIETLEKLNRGRNWTVQEFSSWYADEAAHAYSARGGEAYYRTTVSTYQTVTKRECMYSCVGEEDLEGYVEDCEMYIYPYDADELDQYTAYLESRGFTYYKSTAIDGVVKTGYAKENEGLMVVLWVTALSSGLELLGVTIGRIS